jgi:phosphoserine phosphatase
MDSTMIGQECIDELAAEVGLRPHIAAIGECALRVEFVEHPQERRESAQ